MDRLGHSCEGLMAVGETARKEGAVKEMARGVEQDLPVGFGFHLIRPWGTLVNLFKLFF